MLIGAASFSCDLISGVSVFAMSSLLDFLRLFFKMPGIGEDLDGDGFYTLLELSDFLRLLPSI